MTSVQRVQSGSPWEEPFGFARAVRAGDRVVVGGTTSFKGGVLYGEGDPYEQARTAFGTALAAMSGSIREGGWSYYLTRSRPGAAYLTTGPFGRALAGTRGSNAAASC